MPQSRYNVEVVLVHAPVVNRNGETIGSAVTNLDLHDIARAGKTYGVETYWVVTPYEEQQALVHEIVDHWRDGYGAKKDSDRAQALSLVQVSPDVENVIEQATQKYGRRPVVLVTGASSVQNLVDYQETRQLIEEGVPVLLFFGTAWGLDSQVVEMADGSLPPIRGRTSFNHLSVRSAVSIILDRLLAENE